MLGLLSVSRRAELTTMAKYNPNLVKINRNYTFEELSAVFGIHKNTIASWVKSGLPCLKDQRPFLILGTDAKAYLKTKRTTGKRKCKADEMYCMRCKAPVLLAGNSAEYVPVSRSKGRLTGFCCECECQVNKFVARASVDKYSALFNLSVPTVLEHISDSNNPL